MSSKICIVIAGPTAIGKTALAIRLAQYYHTEIISADSRQCYTELNIGVAKPAPEELNTIPHHFINSHSITQTVSAADFERYALDTLSRLFTRHNIVIVVGGTGLYLRALCRGLDTIPAIAPELREALREQYAREGLSWLQTTVEDKDPAYFKATGQSGEARNPQRLLRALEVVLQTQKSITEFQHRSTILRDFSILSFGLELPRPVLYERINSRVLDMMRQGLVNEARALWPMQHLNALQTVGYRELFVHFEGAYDLEKAVALIRQNTRHYAKRQMTWFKKEDTLTWLSPEAAFDAIRDRVGG
jgi:tRNA dimethylallyltransferase